MTRPRTAEHPRRLPTLERLRAAERIAGDAVAAILAVPRASQKDHQAIAELVVRRIVENRDRLNTIASHEPRTPSEFAAAGERPCRACGGMLQAGSRFNGLVTILRPVRAEDDRLVAVDSCQHCGEGDPLAREVTE